MFLSACVNVLPVCNASEGQEGAYVPWNTEPPRGYCELVLWTWVLCLSSQCSEPAKPSISPGPIVGVLKAAIVRTQRALALTVPQSTSGSLVTPQATISLLQLVASLGEQRLHHSFLILHSVPFCQSEVIKRLLAQWCRFLSFAFRG